MKRILVTLLAAAIGFVVGALFQWGLAGLAGATALAGGLGWMIGGLPGGGSPGTEARWQGSGDGGGSASAGSGSGDGGG